MFNIDLVNKIAWVTGGGRGIGKSISLGLSAAGCKVAIGYVNHEMSARETEEQIRKQGKESLLVQGDVSNQQDLLNAHQAITKTLGQVDILVNCAGIEKSDYLLNLEESAWKHLMDVNLMGCVNTIKLCAPSMMLKCFGRIVNITSSVAQKGNAGQTAYAASKAGVEALSRCLSIELAPRDITVNCIAPGYTDTEMIKSTKSRLGNKIFDQQIIKRFCPPENIASWVVLLASEYGSHITGQVISMDGTPK